MTIEMQSNESECLTTFTASGELTYEEVSDAIKSYYENAPAHNVLWNLLAASTAKITTAQVDLISHELEQFRKNSKGAKTAIVAPSGASFGLSRMLQTLLEVKGDPPPVELKVFRDMEEAFRWVREEEK